VTRVTRIYNHERATLNQFHLKFFVPTWRANNPAGAVAAFATEVR
jgi:hypothetical protein